MISSKITIEFNRLKAEIKEAFIAVGMITDEKFDFFSRNIPAYASVFIITGIHLPTSPSVLRKLKDSTIINAKAYAKKFFHPKLYLFKTNDGWVAFVGSGNFTNGGWQENEELFLKIIDEYVCLSLKEKFDSWFSDSFEISDSFLEVYEQTFKSNLPLRKEAKTNISQLIDFLNSNFNIENVNFTDQFFQKSDHLTFQPGKTHLETEEILAERKEVRNKLFALNDMLVRNIPISWNIHPHYDNEHIVAHIENNFHHDYNVKSLWIAYGRNRKSLKVYGDWATPLKFMRLQVIVHYNTVGIWLMPGKNGDGQIDREHFAKKMHDSNYRQGFFDLLMVLGELFWIKVAEETRTVTDFDSPDKLWDFTKNDKWRDYYFIIGRDFTLGSAELKKENIVETVINNFKILSPIYNLLLEKSLG